MHCSSLFSVKGDKRMAEYETAYQALGMYEEEDETDDNEIHVNDGVMIHVCPESSKCTYMMMSFNIIVLFCIFYTEFLILRELCLILFLYFILKSKIGICTY